jgi:hypothetical protein
MRWQVCQVALMLVLSGLTALACEPREPGRANAPPEAAPPQPSTADQRACRAYYVRPLPMAQHGKRLTQFYETNLPTGTDADYYIQWPTPAGPDGTGGQTQVGVVRIDGRDVNAVTLEANVGEVASGEFSSWVRMPSEDESTADQEVQRVCGGDGQPALEGNPQAVRNRSDWQLYASWGERRS